VSDRPAPDHVRPAPAVTDAPAQSTLLIGSVLRTSATLFPKLFVPFVLVALVEWLPNLLTINNPGFATTSEIARNLEGIFLDIVLGTIGVAIIVGGVVQYLRKETISLRDPLELAIRRFGSILVLALLVAMIWIIGLMLFIIPGLVLMSVMFVTIPAYQIERLGPLASIKRSAQLTKNYRWKVFALLSMTSGVQVLVDQGLESLHTWTEGAMEMVAAMLIWNTVWGLFASIVTGVTYFELRRAKEGVDAHQIASIFD